jgi:hypothetical protein|tara:strand:+ start:111 stop:290 length:180 start_codon:yes stop_codon:yes gene_type:complete
MEQHIIDIREDYGQFIEIDIESLEVIRRVPKKVNEYMKPSLIHSIYTIVMFVLKQIHEV